MTEKNEAKPESADSLPESDMAPAPPSDDPPAAETDEKAAPEPEATIERLEARVTELEEQMAAEQDRALRARAEAENTAKRAARERADALKYGASNLARDVLEVVDNLERALASIPPDAEAKVEDVATLREGVKLTLQELNAKFRRHDIQRIAPPAGEPFDPTLHQAVTQIERPDLPGGSVAELLQAGYRHHDRLLRAAVVATTPKRSETQAADSTDAEDGADETAATETDTESKDSGAAEPFPETPTPEESVPEETDVAAESTEGEARAGA